MGKYSNWLRRFLGGLIALIGACLIGWQAVLIYYLTTGRVKAGEEEYLPLLMAAVIMALGLFLFWAGYAISKTGVPRAGEDGGR